MAYAEFDACIAAGLDLERWEGESSEKPYSKRIKTHVMAWHNLSSLIRAHSDQALLDKARKDRKKK